MVDPFPLREAPNIIESTVFARAKMCVYRNLLLSCYPSFLTSTFYSKLLGFRLLEKTLPTRHSFEFLRVLGEGGFGKVHMLYPFLSRGRLCERTRSGLGHSLTLLHLDTERMNRAGICGHQARHQGHVRLQDPQQATDT